MIRVLQAFVNAKKRRVGRRCEDVFDSTSRAAWVIDAAGIPPGTAPVHGFSGAWFAEALSQALRDRIDKNESLARIVQESLAELYGQFSLFLGRENVEKLDQRKFPRGFASIIRLSPLGSLEYYVMGDVFLGVSLNGNLEAITDDRQAHFNRIYFEELASLQRSGCSYDSDEYNRKLDEMVTREFSLLNLPNGYPQLVPSLDFRGIGVAGEIPLSRYNDIKILLASDGASRLWTDFKIVSNPSDLLEKGQDLRSLVTGLRQQEEVDKSGTMYPRIGASDDATLAILDISL